MGPPP
ncbi:hypothetical protein VCCP1035_3623A, partial [Vibrio cholerae CP1035(8)]